MPVKREVWIGRKRDINHSFQLTGKKWRRGNLFVVDNVDGVLGHNLVIGDQKPTAFEVILQKILTNYPTT